MRRKVRSGKERSGKEIGSGWTSRDPNSCNNVVSCYVNAYTRNLPFKFSSYSPLNKFHVNKPSLQRTQQELVYNHDHIERYQWNYL